MNRRYVVTGAQGFIGRYQVAYLLERFPDAAVLGMGRSRSENSFFVHSVSRGSQVVPSPLPEPLRRLDFRRYSYVRCELGNSECSAILRDFDPTTVIHLAASLRGETEEQIVQNNLRSTEGLLNAIRKTGLRPRFLLASTGGVYGNQRVLPIKETSPPDPIDAYSTSKLKCEELVQSFAEESSTRITIARIFNVLGPGQDELHFAGRMAGQIAASLSTGSPPVIRAGLLAATRDFLDVRDVCAALIALTDNKLDGICNVGSGVETKIGDLLQLLISAAGVPNAQIIEEKNASSPILRHFANTDRLSQTGFVPKYSLQQSCQEMLDYYRHMVYSEAAHS